MDDYNLKDKTLFITGSSRGIGKAIALRAAQDGANIAVVGKTKEPHPKLPGTVYSAVEEIESAGGNAIPLICDIRFEDQVESAVNETVEQFGGIDICVNNASAISLLPTAELSMKRYDLIMDVNIRGTFLTTKLCLPYLKESDTPHVLVISPPLILEPRWFKNHVAYTISKYGMSMCVLGMSEEFKKYFIPVNALWPRTSIATMAVENIIGGKKMKEQSRKPEIMADAAYLILTNSSSETTGNFYIDDEVLIQHGICDLSEYAVNPNTKLLQDFFLYGDGPISDEFCDDTEE